MAERVEASAAPQETLVRDLSSRVQSVASLVFDNASVERWGNRGVGRSFFNLRFILKN